MVGAAHHKGCGARTPWVPPYWATSRGGQCHLTVPMVGGAHPIGLGSEGEALSHRFGFALVLDFDADFTAGAKRARPG